MEDSLAMSSITFDLQGEPATHLSSCRKRDATHGSRIVVRQRCRLAPKQLGYRTDVLCGPPQVLMRSRCKRRPDTRTLECPIVLLHKATSHKTRHFIAYFESRVLGFFSDCSDGPREVTADARPFRQQPIDMLYDHQNQALRAYLE